MSLHFPLPGPVKLTDNVGREDVVPMDISPEPTRVVHQSRIASGRARAFTTTVRLFGRDLSNGVSVVLSQAQSHNFLQG